MPFSSRRSPSEDADVPMVLVTLEILHGRTKFPQRPVHAPRYLIGSAEACDLRLGGPAIPRLHSLIAIEGDVARIELIAEGPALLINGQSVREAELCAGDLLRIADFELRVQVSTAPAAVAMLEDDRDAEDLSALELIERLEADTKLVETHERRRQLGAEALLEAARQTELADEFPSLRGSQRMREPVGITVRASISVPVQVSAPVGPVTTVAAVSTQELVRELEQLGKTLHELSVELDQQHAHSAERESTYAAATQGLLETQHALTAQIEALARQVSELQTSVRPSRPRAIA